MTIIQVMTKDPDIDDDSKTSGYKFLQESA